MCGIAGQASVAGAVDVAEVDAMVAVVSHRGPDAQGTTVVATRGDVPTVVFGHRRLRVIDLSAAADQPLRSEDGMRALVFNGEIYNFRELRRELEAFGHRFRSDGDGEVIVHGYERWGDGVLDRLEGMFAFALWDETRARLLLARDAVGKKPLYYAWNGERLAFGSELKALRRCAWVDAALDPDVLPALLAGGYVPWPRTMYRGIAQVPPGASIALEGGSLQPARAHWRSPFLPGAAPRARTLPESAAVVRAELLAAVERRLVSDVPLGVLLSGGVDSAAVVAAAAAVGARVRTFTAGVAGHASWDERGDAAELARHFGTEHVELEVAPDAASLVETVLWHLDEPMADSSCVPTYLIAREARRHVTVVLTGDGGDEVFAGYDRFRGALLADALPRAAQLPARAAAAVLPAGRGYASPGERARRFAAELDRPVAERYRDWVSVFPQRLLDDVLEGGATGATEAFDAAWEESAGAPLLDRLQHVNLRTYLHDDLLVKIDRMTMAHGLEARSPLLDRRLIEVAAALPPSHRATIRTSKRVLREAVRPLLPEAVLRRRKHGFGVPVGDWFRGTLRAPLHDLVLDGSSRLEGIVRRPVVEALARDHLSGRAEHGQRLWALLALECWLRSQERGDLRSGA